MISHPQTLIIRHNRENLKKCSLRGLENNPHFRFFTYPSAIQFPDLSSYIVLTMNAPLLSKEDGNLGLILLDATWRLAAKMEKNLKLDAHPLRRSLPPLFKTAYPRRQADCPSPNEGLASIEALYVSYLLIGRPIEGLLDNYYWKESFLEKKIH